MLDSVEGMEAWCQGQVCGRTFSMDRIAKHQAVCLKLRKKRPVFQAQRQRVFLEAGRLGVVLAP